MTGAVELGLLLGVLVAAGLYCSLVAVRVRRNRGDEGERLGRRRWARSVERAARSHASSGQELRRQLRPVESCWPAQVGEARAERCEARPARCREKGSATVGLLGVLVAGATLLVGALELARAVATSHRAMAAADLAALAGANAASGGSSAMACGSAARVAALNGGAMQQCVAASDGSVTVVVSVVSAAPWRWQASGRARAGPSQADAT